VSGRLVSVISTGVANEASVCAALRRCGAAPELTGDPAAAREAQVVVLPGVGSFEAGMSRLRERGLGGALVDRVRAGRPLLAICLGMQMLCRSSEEAPGVPGLGVIDAEARRFTAGTRTPHFGWNRVETDHDSVCVRGAGHAYFAHSYRVASAPAGWRAATADHGGLFVAALERGGVLACQFHPELSGAWGVGLIGRWLERAEEAAAC